MRPGVFAVAVAASCAVAGVAAAADGPYYLSGSFGGYFRQSDQINATLFSAPIPIVTAPGTVGRTYDPGLVINLAAGYRLTSHLRVEAELGYAAYSGSTLKPATLQPSLLSYQGQTFNHVSGDDLSRLTGTLNGFYDFSPVRGVTPYVGAGFGDSANHQSSGLFREADGGRFADKGGSATHGLALLEAGFSIPLSRNLYLVPAYRYVHYFAAGQDVSHVVKIGLRYGF